MSAKIFQFDVPALCALPLVRRCYQAMVAGLAVFILTLVIWREPFRGYLAEVHLSGPQAEGIDLVQAVGWIKEANKHVAAIATAAGEISTKPQIRATFVAARPHAATDRLDELAERFLFQYLPDRLQNYRHATLAELRNTAQAAREREDAARMALESLRQKQLALVLRTANESVEKNAAAAVKGNQGIVKSGSMGVEGYRGPDGPRSPIVDGNHSVETALSSSPKGTELSEGRAKAIDKLHLLRLELAGLMANCTEQHPDVITLRLQIAAMERELGIGMESREVAKPVQVLKQVSGELPDVLRPRAIVNESGDGKTLSLALSQGERGRAADEAGLRPTLANDESAAILQELAKSSRERQIAEHRLSERMQELTSQPVAAQWSAAPAHVVTRLGGTPRTHTLLFAAILASVMGVVIFRAAADDGCSAKIESTRVLAGALELPVVGNLLAMRDAARQMRRRLLTAERLRVILYGSEIVIGLAVLACVGAIACEPSLARQVFADPFGTLSEVVGRIGQ